MPSRYIVLEREIPNADTYVKGNCLSKPNTELESLVSVQAVSLNAFL
jgi:hypothetical protein